MKTIAVLTQKEIHPNFPFTPEDEYVTPRDAVRIAIFDSEGNVAVGTFKDINNNLCYGDIGGGIDADESKEDALLREALEEAGCRIKNIQELGIIEERGIGSDKKGRFVQTNYCYMADVDGEKIMTSFTEEEKSIQSGVVWLPIEEAIARLKVQGSSFITNKTLMLLEVAHKARKLST